MSLQIMQFTAISDHAADAVEAAAPERVHYLAGAYVVVTVVTVIINAYMGIADLIPTRSVLANSAKVQVPRSWLPALGALKLAGAIGLVAGLVGLPAIGLAAATGLVLFFIGAVITHIRGGVLDNIAFPGGYLLMSAASLVLLAALW